MTAPLSSMLAMDGYQMSFGLNWSQLGWLLSTQVAASFFVPIALILVYYARRFNTTTRTKVTDEPRTPDAHWQDKPWDEEPQTREAA